MTFTATPAEGWHVASWTGDNDICGAGDPENSGADGEIECVLPVGSGGLSVGVTFKRVFAVVYTAQAEGGGLAANTANNEAVSEEAEVRFTATPSAGYYVREWRGDESADGGACDVGTPGTSAAVECDLTVSGGDLNPEAVFAPSNATVYFAQPENGALSARLSAGGAAVADKADVLDRAVVVFSAEPDSGWYVSEWTDDCLNIGATTSREDARDGNGAARECELTIDTLAKVSVTVGAAFAQVPRDLNPDDVAADRTPEYRAATGYFGPGHRIQVGPDYALADETYDAAAMSYDSAGRVIGILEGNPVAEETLRLALTASVSCLNFPCYALNVTITASFVPVADPGQEVFRAIVNEDAAPVALALPSGFAAADVTLSVFGVSGGAAQGDFQVDAQGQVSRAANGAPAAGDYEITAHMTRGGMLGTLALVMTAAISDAEYRVVYSQFPLDRGGVLRANILGANGALLDAISSGDSVKAGSTVRFSSEASDEWHISMWFPDDGKCPLGTAELTGRRRVCDRIVGNTDLTVRVEYGRDECAHATPCAEGQFCIDEDLQNGGGTICEAQYQIGYDAPSEGGALSASSGGEEVPAAGALFRTVHLITFTATPQALYYVALWTGCDSGISETGGDDDNGAKTCRLQARNDATVGVSFARRMRDVSIEDLRKRRHSGGRFRRRGVCGKRRRAGPRIPDESRRHGAFHGAPRRRILCRLLGRRLRSGFFQRRGRLGRRGRRRALRLRNHARMLRRCGEGFDRLGGFRPHSAGNLPSELRRRHDGRRGFADSREPQLCRHRRGFGKRRLGGARVVAAVCRRRRGFAPLCGMDRRLRGAGHFGLPRAGGAGFDGGGAV